MPISLREPFFLRGRRSIVQRAVVMSLVLGGLAMLASWLIYGTVILMARADLPLWISTILGSTVMIASILLLYGPLSYWNRRPWWFIAFVVPTSVTVASLTAAAILNMTISPHEPGWLGLTVAMTLFTGGIGCVLLRRSRVHLIAFMSSLLIAPVVAFQLNLLENYNSSSAPAGMLPVIQPIILVSAYVTILCGLSVPWGIPFWWPHTHEQIESTLQKPAGAGEAG